MWINLTSFKSEDFPCLASDSNSGIGVAAAPWTKTVSPMKKVNLKGFRLPPTAVWVFSDSAKNSGTLRIYLLQSSYYSVLDRNINIVLVHLRNKFLSV